MKITDEDLKKFVDEFEKELLNSTNIKYKITKDWKANFPDKAGIYAIFDKNKLSYIGQTDNIKKRMSEVHRTYNHSFRRKLGKTKKINGTIEKGKRKFNDDVEKKLDKYYLKNISIRFKPLNFGRLEVEGRLILKNKSTVLNSENKRIII